MDKPSTEALYNELLYAVETKYQDESRHETALRYIKKAEMRGKGIGVHSKKEEHDKAMKNYHAIMEKATFRES